MRHDTLVLECQACGDVVRRLTPAEAQEVAENPYNFVVFCAMHLDAAVEPEFRP